MKRKTTLNHLQRGATILEVVVALTVLSVTVGVMSQYYSYSQQNQRRIRIRSFMTALAKDVENKLRTPSSIYTSTLLAANIELTLCLLGGSTSSGTGGCSNQVRSYNPAKRKLFALAYASGKDKIEAISSSGTQPIYYNTRGQKCQKTEPLCVFQVETFYYVTCPSDVPEGSSCLNGIEQIHLAYEVKKIPGKLSELGDNFSSIPRTIRFISMTAEAILGPYLNSSCNLGATIRGYQQTGDPICQCAQPYIDVDPPAFNRRGPLCVETTESALMCSAGLLFRGLNDNGTANCIHPDKSFSCLPPITGEDALINGGCGDDYYIYREELSDCEFHCHVGRGGGACFGHDNDQPVKGVNSQGKERIYTGARGPHKDDERKWYRSKKKDGHYCNTRSVTCCKPGLEP